MIGMHKKLTLLGRGRKASPQVSGHFFEGEKIASRAGQHARLVCVELILGDDPVVPVLQRRIGLQAYAVPYAE